ncbi:hypothetical protein AB6N24_07270 [Cellulomonas sp. 179-A 4D5 NHS]|uniref:hypothetical protein n=1 Tax=Cellulomonas sp. 179-A 4D5 NHS TaxID=3142378 RepID=UPI0039A18D40
MSTESTGTAGSKEAAEARKAEAEARKAEAEATEYLSRSAQQLREAERRQKLLAAERDSVAAAAGRYASLVPDLSGVERGTTTVSGTSAMYESELLASALDRACTAIVEAVGPSVGAGPVLVTTELDLVASDAVHGQVDVALAELQSAADGLLSPPEAGGESIAAIGLAAAVLPHVLSLFATSHTVTTSATAPSAAVAGTTLAGALATSTDRVVVHDTFRVLERGPLDVRLDALLTACGQLRETAAVPVQADAEPDPRTALAAELVKRIETFVGTVMAVPSGAARSLWTSARARQRLHDTSATYVLLVQSPTATTNQVVDEKVGKDRFRVVSTVNVPWALVRSDAERILAAGVGSGRAVADGELGQRVTIG